MKKIIAIMLLILIIASSVLIFSVIKSEDGVNKEQLRQDMQKYLEQGEYDAAYSILSKQAGQEIFSEIALNHISEICSQAEKKLDFQQIDEMIEAGFEYKVLGDTKANIQAKLEKISESEQYFKDGIELFDAKDYEAADEMLQSVIEEDANYQAAQSMIEEINQLKSSWESTRIGNSSYNSAIAFDGEYLYFAYRIDDFDGIYKTTTDGKSSDFFPIHSGETRARIYGINVVGDYIYFIAGENVGSGYVYNNPYNIYKIKKDGSNLSLEVVGNFTDLYIAEDEAYAISRDDGLVKFGKYISNYQVISNQSVSEFSYSPKGVYYSSGESMEHDSKNTIYFYDGNSSMKLDNGEYMHYYDFGDNYLKLWTKTDASEVLNLGFSDEEIRVKMADIYKVYGLVDNKVLYSGFGLYQQERLYYYDIESKKNNSLGAYATVMDYEVKGIFYEQNKILIEKDNKLYFTNVDGSNTEEIVIPTISDGENYSEIKKLSDKDYYTEEGDEKIVFIQDKNIWHYKNHELNLYIQKKYYDEYDTNVYITHIFTNNFSLLKTGNGGASSTDTDTYRAYEISDKYGAIYAQSGDTFLDSRNIDRGIVIRDCKIIRDELTYDIMAVFDDGSIKVYHKDDSITAQQLLDMGAHTTFAFGPILVEDYKVVPECAYDELAVRNPRSAIGYVEPGHYVMIVCDGRDEKVSRGLSMIQLAQMFEREGCQTAYNLDGGSTSTITFFGNYITRRTAYPGVPEIYNHRMVAEMIYIGTSNMSPLDMESYTYDYIYFTDSIK
ncbi:MAG: phosphodiester glycosidase family protein [Eubacteriales bacterium]